MKIGWLSDFAEQWRQRLASGRTPHAVMLTGPRGTGKRAAAAWLAASRVGQVELESLPEYPVSVPEHPDVHWVKREEDRQGILIDQVRSLVADLALTSFEGLGKTTVIEPADAMNTAAANSLLKTLEEPAGDALLVLVVDRMGRLPATIVSRCQRIDIALPGQQVALEWLERYQPGEQWSEPLRAAGGAPLEALRAAGRMDLVRTLERDLGAVAEKSASALDVAARWAKEDPYEVLEWMSREIAEAARYTVGVPHSSVNSAIQQSVLQRIDSQNLFCYLDIINRLRNRPAGAFNAQTAFEGLLIDWARGLDRVQPTAEKLDALYALSK